MNSGIPIRLREAGKAERRQRIVAAAADLVRENGLEDVLVTEIAERAGVSPGTVYNSFGTKAGVYRHVFDADLEAFRVMVERVAAKDALDRMFAAVEIAASLYRRDPRFYRAMARVSGSEADGLGARISDAREAFWLDRTAALQAEGVLCADADARLVGTAVARLVRGGFMAWAGNRISTERLAGETAFGMAAIFSAFAAPASLPRLRARLEMLRKKLRDLHRPVRRKS